MSLTVSTNPTGGGLTGPANPTNQSIKAFGDIDLFGLKEQQQETFGNLSDEYKANMQELTAMKKAFYEAHKLPEDDRQVPEGFVGIGVFSKTDAQKQRDEEWKQIENNYMASHPISDADKQVLEKQQKELRRISLLC